MNKHQRIVLFAAAGLIAGMYLLRAPRADVNDYWIFSDAWWWNRDAIAFNVLFGQAGIVLLIAALLVLALKKPSP
jgi:hypothetical protein